MQEKVYGKRLLGQIESRHEDSGLSPDWWAYFDDRQNHLRTVARWAVTPSTTVANGRYGAYLDGQTRTIDGTVFELLFGKL